MTLLGELPVPGSAMHCTEYLYGYGHGFACKKQGAGYFRNIKNTQTRPNVLYRALMSRPGVVGSRRKYEIALGPSSSEAVSSRSVVFRLLCIALSFFPFKKKKKRKRISFRSV